MPPTRQRLPGELSFLVVLLLASLFLLWTAYGISKFESLTSAGAFPMFATAVMVICAVLILRDAARAAPSEAQAGESLAGHFIRRLTPPVVVGFTVAIALYMWLLQPLGFLLSSYLFLVASMALLGSRRWGLNLLVSAGALAAIHAIFQTVFSVVLPSGTVLKSLISGGGA
jgi:putative tricarboxylic transport membrane protein